MGGQDGSPAGGEGSAAALMLRQARSPLFRRRGAAVGESRRAPRQPPRALPCRFLPPSLRRAHPSRLSASLSLPLPGRGWSSGRRGVARLAVRPSDEQGSPPGKKERRPNERLPSTMALCFTAQGKGAPAPASQPAVQPAFIHSFLATGGCGSSLASVLWPLGGGETRHGDPGLIHPAGLPLRGLGARESGPGFPPCPRPSSGLLKHG